MEQNLPGPSNAPSEIPTVFICPPTPPPSPNECSGQQVRPNNNILGPRYNLTIFECPICLKPQTDDYEEALVHNWSHKNYLERQESTKTGADVPMAIRETLISSGRDPGSFSYDNNLIAIIIQNQEFFKGSQFFIRNGPVFKCKNCLHQHIVEGGETAKSVTKLMLIHFLDLHFNRIFVCTICGQRFSAERYLKMHLDMTHPNKAVLPTESPNDPDLLNVAFIED